MRAFPVAFLVAFLLASASDAQGPLKVTNEQIHERLKKEWSKKLVPFDPISNEDGVSLCKQMRISEPGEPGVFARGSLAGPSQDVWYLTEINGQSVSSGEAASKLLSSVAPGSTVRVKGQKAAVPSGKKSQYAWIKSEGPALVDSPLNIAAREIDSKTDDVEKFVNITARGVDLDPMRLRINKVNEKTAPRLFLDVLLVNDDWVFPTEVKLSINDTLFEFKVKPESAITENTAEKTYESFSIDVSDRPDFVKAILDDQLEKAGTVRFSGKRIQDRAISFDDIRQSRQLLHVFYRDRFGE